MNNSTIYLFRFTSYSYCQGTRDTYRGDLRLLQFASPTDKQNAIDNLMCTLEEEGVEVDYKSIEVLTHLINN